jgi:DNA polymerase type B, organellar and viral
MTERKFIAFDGEGDHDRYILLADSTGAHIADRAHGLTLLECLKFLTRPELSGSISVWFAFDYDVNMIFKPINAIEFWQGKRPIRVGRYVVQYQAGKWLKIRIGKKTFTHYDTFGFFQVSFKQAIADWLGVDDPLINRGKADRHSWRKWPMDRIAAYNARECELLATLIGRLNETLIALPHKIKLSSWHGAGAVSGSFLRSIGLHKEIAGSIVPAEVDQLAQRAFFGGRIEMIQRGKFNRIWHGDIRSAYPAGMLNLPDLSRSTWGYINRFIPGKVGIYEIEFEGSPSDRIGAFPYRHSNGAVVFPVSGAGVYWSWEVVAAMACGVKVKVKHGWYISHFVASALRPAIRELYALRKKYRSAGNAAQAAIKLVINSAYGKIAQRPSSSRSAFHSSIVRSIVLAGMITSQTRATLYNTAMMQNSDDVISFATDGLYTLSDREVIEGENLGEWDVERIDSGLFIQSGFHRLQHAPGDEEIKTRGYHAREIDFDRIIGDLSARGRSSLKIDRFVTKLLALTQPIEYPTGAIWQQVRKDIKTDSDYKRIWRADKWGEKGYQESIPSGADFMLSAPYNPKLYEWSNDPIEIGE